MMNEKPLLTGRVFRLKSETVAVDSSGPKRIAVMVCAGEIIEVVSDPFPTDLRMVGIRSQGRALAMFAEDVERRGQEVKDRMTKATRACSVG
jgi:hypothetical protein